MKKFPTQKVTFFNRSGQKASGNTHNYIATKQNDSRGLPFTIKVANKNPIIKMSTPWLDERNSSFDTMNFINEFITAPLYARTLSDQAPIIDELKSNNQNLICLRSKFSHHFNTIAEFTYSKLDCLMGEQKIKLKVVSGAEKVFAAMLTWGEFDAHPGSLGIMKTRDTANNNQLVCAKLDHSWSATQFFTNPTAALENLANTYLIHGYQPNLQLNAIKFKSALEEIVNISDGEIEKLIQVRIDKLKHLRIEIRHLLFFSWTNATELHYQKSRPNAISQFTNLDELEHHYLTQFKRQIMVMRKVAKRLNIITKINNPISTPEEQTSWINGEWLLKIGGNDPIAWAVKNSNLIEGIDPILWAINHNQNIENTDPMLWAIKNGTAWSMEDAGKMSEKVIAFASG